MRIALRTIAAALATAAALFVPGLLTAVAPAIVRAAAVAVALLYLPGRCASDALATGPARTAVPPATGAARLWRFWVEYENAPLAFALSLALLVAATAFAWSIGGGPRVVAAALVALTAGAAWLGGRRGYASDARVSDREGHGALALGRLPHAPRTPDGDANGDGDHGPAALYALVLAAAVASTATAVVFTHTGSVDRWWTLAYVADWAAGALDAGEPLLGSGNVLPRFALNVWTAALATWTALSGAEALWLFERAAPALLLPLGIAAHAMLGRALFGSTRSALLTALAAAACWSAGGPVAALTRAPEDKVLAVIVLAPVLWAAGIRALDVPWRSHDEGRGGDAGYGLHAPPQWTAATFGAALAVAAVHPLVFVLAAAPLAAYALLTAWSVPASRARAVALVAALLAASALPLTTGAAARAAYVRDGAADLGADHPVARVHRNRSRLVDAGALGYAVDPRLLANPIIALALVGLVLLVRRSARERRFLVPAALAPLALAFVPPLATAAGAVVMPWMVHRVLWTIPFAALAAVAADEAARRRGRIATLAIGAVLVLTAVAPALDAARARARAAREVLAFPYDDGELAAVLDALRSLPAGAVVAAAHELSERLPALAGVRVLAMSDRATIVFAGSRDAGEQRLRARAAVFSGTWRHEDGVPDPTHVLVAPNSPAMRYCAEEQSRTGRFVLCAFRAVPPPPGVRLAEVDAAHDGTLRIALARDAAGECVGHTTVMGTGMGVSRFRPGPWSADFPTLSCRVLIDPAGGARTRTLVLRPLLGSAVDEWTVVASATRAGAPVWNVRTRRRVREGETLRFGLPRAAADTVNVEITPSFLPFVKLTDLALTLAEPVQTAP